MTTTMDTKHPAAIAARAAAETKRKRRALERDCMLRAKREHNLRFLTIDNYSICYRVDRRNVIELSTSIKHPNDRFDKHVGQWVAFERFRNNNRIHLKIPTYLEPKNFLTTLFTSDN